MLAEVLLNGGRGALLLRSGVISIGIKIVFTLLSFFISLTLARVLGPEGFGVYSFCLAILMLVSIPVQSGYPMMLVREVAKARGLKNFSLIASIQKWAFSLILVTSILIVIVVFLLEWKLSIVLGSIRSSVFYIGVVLIPCVGLILAQGAVMRGLGWVNVGQFFDAILRPLLFLIVLLCSYSIGLSVQSVMELKVLVTVFVLAASTTVALYVQRGFIFRRVSLSNESDGFQWGQLVMPLMAVSGFQLVNGYVDIVVLGMIRTDEEVGVYRVVVQMGNLVIFALVAVNQILHPLFARQYDAGEMVKLQKMVTTSARLILLLSVPIAVIFAVWSEQLLSFFFGVEYVAGGLPLCIVAIGQLTNAAFGSVAALLNMTGHEKDTMRGMFIAFVVNVILNLVLVPEYGMVGAAIATAFSILCWNAVLRHYVKKRLGIESSSWRKA